MCDLLSAICVTQEGLNSERAKWNFKTCFSVPVQTKEGQWPNRAPYSNPLLVKLIMSQTGALWNVSFKNYLWVLYKPWVNTSFPPTQPLPDVTKSSFYYCPEGKEKRRVRCRGRERERESGAAVDKSRSPVLVNHLRRLYRAHTAKLHGDINSHYCLKAILNMSRRKEEG